MLIFIAESKSMQCAGVPSGVPAQLPEFLPEAEAIVDGLRGLGVAELAARLKLGPKNAQRLFDEVYSFGDAATATPAIDAYTGVVFRALDVPTLDAAARTRLSRDLRIVSSLYGTLRPDDLIQSYRLDFGMKAAPGDKTLSAYWKSRLTLALIRHIKESGETDILNLLPMDASKCYDWKLIKGFAKVYIPNFQLYTDGGTLKTPNSDLLKRLRGKLLRHILEQDLRTGAQLRELLHPDMMYRTDEPYPRHLQFITA